MGLEPMIYTMDLKGSIEFYRDKLGFEVEEYYPDNKNPKQVCILSRATMAHTYYRNLRTRCNS